MKGVFRALAASLVVAGASAKVIVPANAACTAGNLSSTLHVFGLDETADADAGADYCKTVTLGTTEKTDFSLDFGVSDLSASTTPNDFLSVYVFNAKKLARANVYPVIDNAASNIGDATVSVTLDANGGVSSVTVDTNCVWDCRNNPNITFANPSGDGCVQAVATVNKDPVTNYIIDVTVTESGSCYSDGPFFDVNAANTLSLKLVNSIGQEYDLTTSDYASGYSAAHCVSTATGCDGTDPNDNRCNCVDVARTYQSTQQLPCDGQYKLVIETSIPQQFGIILFWDADRGYDVVPYGNNSTRVYTLLGGPGTQKLLLDTVTGTGSSQVRLGEKSIYGATLKVTPVNAQPQLYCDATGDNDCNVRSGKLMTVTPDNTLVRRYTTDGYGVLLSRPTRHIKSAAVLTGGVGYTSEAANCCKITSSRRGYLKDITVVDPGEFEADAGVDGSVNWPSIIQTNPAGGGTLFSVNIDSITPANGIVYNDLNITEKGSGYDAEFWDHANQGANFNDRFLKVKSYGTIGSIDVLDGGYDFPTTGMMPLVYIPTANSGEAAVATVAASDVDTTHGNRIKSVTVTSAGTGYDQAAVSDINGRQSNSADCTGPSNCPAFIGKGISTLDFTTLGSNNFINGTGCGAGYNSTEGAVEITATCNNCGSSKGRMLVAPTAKVTVTGGKITEIALETPGVFSPGADDDIELSWALSGNLGSPSPACNIGNTRLDQSYASWIAGASHAMSGLKWRLILRAKPSMIKPPILLAEFTEDKEDAECKFQLREVNDGASCSGVAMGTNPCSGCTNFSISGVEITNGGLDYVNIANVSELEVIFDTSGNCGTAQASATAATFDAPMAEAGTDAKGAPVFDHPNGKITGVTVTTAGSGYASAPRGRFWSYQRIARVVKDPMATGNTYAEAPRVSIGSCSSGNNFQCTTGAAATFNTTTGMVTGVTFAKSGMYLGTGTETVTLTPKWSIKNVSLAGDSVADLGCDITGTVVVTFTQECTSSSDYDNCGRGAHGTATVNTTSKQISGITVVDGGVGYNPSNGDITMKFHADCTSAASPCTLPTTSYNWDSSASTGEILINDVNVAVDTSTFVGILEYHGQPAEDNMWADVQFTLTTNGNVATPGTMTAGHEGPTFNETDTTKNKVTARFGWNAVTAVGTVTGVTNGLPTAVTVDTTGDYGSGTWTVSESTNGNTAVFAFEDSDTEGVWSEVRWTATQGGGDAGELDAYRRDNDRMDESMPAKTWSNLGATGTQVTINYSGDTGGCLQKKEESTSTDKFYPQGFAVDQHFTINNGNFDNWPKADQSLWDQTPFGASNDLNAAIIAFDVEFSVDDAPPDITGSANKKSNQTITYRDNSSHDDATKYYRITPKAGSSFAMVKLHVDITSGDHFIGASWRWASPFIDETDDPDCGRSSWQQAICDANTKTCWILVLTDPGDLDAMYWLATPTTTRDMDVRVHWGASHCNTTDDAVDGDQLTFSLYATFEGSDKGCRYHGDCRARTGVAHPVESKRVSASANKDTSRFGLCGVVHDIDQFDVDDNEGPWYSTCFECEHDCDCGAGQYCVSMDLAVCQNERGNKELCAGQEDLWWKVGTCQNKDTRIFDAPCNSYGETYPSSNSAYIRGGAAPPVNGALVGSDSNHPSDGYCGEYLFYDSTHWQISERGKRRKTLWHGTCVNHKCRECQNEGVISQTSTASSDRQCGTRQCVDGRWAELSGTSATGKLQSATTETDRQLQSAMSESVSSNADVTSAILAFVIILVICSIVTIFLLFKVSSSKSA